MFALFIGGCATANIKTGTTDKQPYCEASYFSLFKSSEAVNMNACGGKGGAKGNQSEQVSEALMGALIKGLKP